MKGPTTLSAPESVAISIDFIVGDSVSVEGRVPYWGPVVIEGHVVFELLLEENSPIA